MQSIPFARQALVIVAFWLAGCGGGGGGGRAVTPPAPPPPPPPPLPAVDPHYLVSGQSPFAANCDGVAMSGTLYLNAEVEPHLAVSPLDANHMVAVWQQDRWSNGSARGLMSAVSFDGGANWARTPLPFSRCGGGTAANGGDYTRVTDPWVTFTPTGIAYAMGLSTTGASFQPGSVNAMLVSRSVDRGRTWSAPVTVIRDGPGFFNDKNAITADPLDANVVYAVWHRLVAGDAGGPTFFSRTTDGGASWETPRAIFDPGPTSQTIGNVIVVLPNGTLANVFTRLDLVAGVRNASVNVIRSSDRGTTWSAPVRIAELLAIGARDPDTNTAVRDGSLLPQVAVDRRNGQLFVVWQDARFSAGAVDAIALSRSTDGGLTWSPPLRVNNTATGVHAFTPTVHVRDDGTVGVTYYDFRANTADPGVLQTEYWLARSADGGVSWTESRIANVFDLDTAPIAGGYFLGDYQALGSRGGVFVPLFVRTSSGDANNRTDVFAAPAVSAVGASGGAMAAAPAAPDAAAAVSPQWRQATHANLEMQLRFRGVSTTTPARDPGVPRQVRLRAR